MTEVPGLLARTVQTLQDAGRLVRTDWGTETFDVLAEEEGAEPTAGVVLSATNSVIFYAVWPDLVPDERRDAVRAYTTEANTELATSAFEFNPSNGILSVRAGIEFGTLAETIDSAALGGLLINALDEVERVAADHRATVAALLVQAQVP